MKHVGVLAVVCVAFASSGCGQPPRERVQDRELAVVLPVTKAWLYRKELSVQLAKGEALTRVVDMSVFDTFKPGDPIARIKAGHGDPTGERTDHRGTFYGYSTAKGRIEIAHEKSASDLVGEWSAWTVWAYPAQPAASAIFTEPLLKYVQAERPETLVVMTSGRERLLATLAGAQVSELRWYLVSED